MKDWDRWEEDFQAIRRAWPARWGWLIRPRLRLATGALNRLRGGAFVWLSWVWVHRDYEGAPDFVRRFVIGHEWGHVVHGHHLASMIMVALAPIAVVGAAIELVTDKSWATSLVVLLAIVLYGPLGFWAMAEKREREADAFAARDIGMAEAAAAVHWIAERRGMVGNARLMARERALRRLAPGD